MRRVLQYLGIIRPDRSQREPVAVPTWVPVAAHAALLLAALVFGFGLSAVARELLF